MSKILDSTGVHTRATAFFTAVSLAPFQDICSLTVDVVMNILRCVAGIVIDVAFVSLRARPCLNFPSINVVGSSVRMSSSLASEAGVCCHYLKFERQLESCIFERGFHCLLSLITALQCDPEMLLLA